ncbi:MAG: phosphonoacetaldehyde reductase [Planctomycetaceae bacterium]|nr:phosphonoacetaldehyde reductase [Planctomycetaceae bacterium]
MLHFGAGVASRLGAEIPDGRPLNIFCVIDRPAYLASGAETIVVRQLASHHTTWFDAFEPNPKFDDVLRGVAAIRGAPHDLIIAIGGGSAIDVAKLIRAFAGSASPIDIVHGREPVGTSPIRLIAMPTTAGTGSEATQFAVVYVEGRKHSVDAPPLRPDVAIVDPDLTRSLPRRVAIASGLDAFCQAIESLWSVNASEASMHDAERAATLSWTNLPQLSSEPTDATLSALCEASHLAGRAINQTRTTAPHALSYTLTSQYGVPHGIAVAVTLASLLEFNAGVTDRDCADPRGPEAVRSRISRILTILGAATVSDACERIVVLLQRLDVPTTLREAGVKSREQLRVIVESVNLQRLSNNPRVATTESLLSILSAGL